jgi:hypothetical protein
LSSSEEVEVCLRCRLSALQQLENISILLHIVSDETREEKEGSETLSLP